MHEFASATSGGGTPDVSASLRSAQPRGTGKAESLLSSVALRCGCGTWSCLLFLFGYLKSEQRVLLRSPGIPKKEAFSFHQHIHPPFIYLYIHLSIQVSTHASICPSTHHPPIHLPTYSPIYPPFHPPIHPQQRQPIYLAIHQLIYIPTHLSIQPPFASLSICSPIHLLTSPSSLKLTHPLISSYVQTLSCLPIPPRLHPPTRALTESSMPHRETPPLHSHIEDLCLLKASS